MPKAVLSAASTHVGAAGSMTAMNTATKEKNYIYSLLPFLLLTSGRSSVIIVSLRTRRDVRVVYGAGLENQ